MLLLLLLQMVLRKSMLRLKLVLGRMVVQGRVFLIPKLLLLLLLLLLLYLSSSGILSPVRRIVVGWIAPLL